jgi:hypothetical protein
LVHSFRGFSPWSLGSIASGPMCSEAEHRGRENMVEKNWLSSWWTRDRERERQKKRVFFLPYLI